MRERIDAFEKGKGDEARRASVAQALLPKADAFAAAADALDARADAAVAANDAVAAAAIYAQLRSAENAFFQPDSAKWSRTLLYSVSGYAGGVLPSLDATLLPDGGSALATLQGAFDAAIQAAAAR